MKNNTTTNPRPVWALANPSEELTLCEVVRYITLRAMHQSNGTSTALNSLIYGCYTDKVWSDTASRQSTADRLRTISKNERTIADKARQTLNCIKTTEAERAEAYAVLTHYTTLADNDLAEAQDIEADNSALTATLAQDLLHTIWIDLQAIKTNPDRQTEEAFGELCKTARLFITNLTAVTTIDGLDTISRPLSRDEAVFYMTRYNADPGARPRHKWTQTAKGCTGYYTLEPKHRKKDLDPRKVDPAIIAQYAHYNEAVIWYYENITLASTHSATRSAYPHLDAKQTALRYWHRLTPAQKATALNLDPAEDEVLYLVLHVPTIRTHQSTEDLTDHDPRTAEQVTEATLASVDVVALADRANLSTQARKAVEALTHPEAVDRAKTARQTALDRGEASLAKLQADRATAGKKPYTPGKVKQMREGFKQTADNAYTSALWEYALTLAEYAPTAQAKAKCIIVGKLAKAYNTAPDALTPGRIDYEAMMRSTHRGNPTGEANRLDLVAVWQTHGAKAPKHRPVVRWTESGATPEALTPGKDYRAEEVLLRDSYRATAPKATPPEKTPKEARDWERLCKREAELADLWKSFDSIYGAMERPKYHK